MAEPQNIRSQRTRARLLQAAWDVLVAEGPEGTTMSAVGEAAGVSRRGVYLHFSSRSELLNGLAGFVDGELGLDDALAVVKAAPNAIAMLDAVVHHLIEYHGTALPLLEALQRAPASDEDTTALWKTTVDSWRRGWGELATALEAEDVLSDRWTVPTATDALVALAIGFMPMWRQLVDESGWSRDDFYVFYRDLHRATFVRDGALDPKGGR